jgi:hypothetical protein
LTLTLSFVLHSSFVSPLLWFPCLQSAGLLARAGA